MGDRRMAEIRTEHGSIYLYTHWQGSVLPQLAKAAVERAAPRLGDQPYWVRIVIDQITKSSRDAETGFGISLKADMEDSYNNDHPSVVIDAATGKVSVLRPGQKRRP